MEIKIKDSGLNSALKEALGHPVPFTVEECAKLKGPLYIASAKNLSLLQDFTNLQHLEIFASEIVDLNFLTKLKKLSILKVRCSSIKNVHALANCGVLESLEIAFTFVEDLHPFLDLPQLKIGRLIGNPWSAESYRVLRPKLLSKSSPYWGIPPALEFSDVEDWELTVELQQLGIQACFATIDLYRPVLVRPGIGCLTGSACDFVSIPDWLVWEKIDTPNITTKSLFSSLIKEDEHIGDGQTFDFESHRILGHGEAAKTWVTSSTLPNSTKDALLRFIHRFPQLVFYKEDDTFLDLVEVDKNVKLPNWLREIRKVLAFIMPGDYPLIHLDRFEQWSPRADNLTEIWYQFNLIGYANNEQRNLLEQAQIFPIGHWMAAGDSSLAINLGVSDDQQVYEYSEEDLMDNVYEGIAPSKSVRVVFNSYADLFDHIVAIEIKPGEIVKAIED